MSLYSPYYPAGAQFDDNAPWNDSHVEKSIHEIDAEHHFPTCKNCGKPIEYLPNIKIPCCQWIHIHGHYGCNEGRPTHSETYAEPREAVVVPDNPAARAWKKRLEDSLKKEVR